LSLFGTRADGFFHPLSLTAKKVENKIFTAKENGYEGMAGIFRQKPLGL
jgi:hypothetical protein